MSRIVWDALGERLFEIGLDRGVLYTLSNEEGFTNGIPWNGLTGVDDSNGGHESTPLYSNDLKIDAVYTNEEYGGTIKCYTYPRELEELLGEVKIATGLYARQQARGLFGFCYRTLIGNDVYGENFGYKLHLVYNARVGDYSRSYSSISSSLSAGDISIPFETFPLEIEGMDHPISEIVVDSTMFGTDRMTWLEEILYGTNNSNDPARLPYPEEIIELYSNEDLTQSDWSGYPNDLLYPTTDLYPGSADIIIDDTGIITRNGSVTLTIAGNDTAEFYITDFISIPIGYSVIGIGSYHSSASEVVALSISANDDYNALQFINTSQYQVSTTLTVYFLLSE